MPARLIVVVRRTYVDRVFASWAGLASHLIGDCFDTAKPYIDNDCKTLSALVRFVTAQLYIACHLSSESVLLLVKEEKEWDAELVARALIEGSLKLSYLLHGQPDEIETKADEYWNLLPQFHSIKHSERARALLNDLPEPDHPKWNPFRELVLDDSTIADIRSRYPRRKRRRLEEQWSFAGICRTFAKSNDPRPNLFVHLAHGYGMSSHVLHMDGDGIGIIWDRYQRDLHRQTAARLGHSARLVSDVCTFAKLRTLSLLRACGEPMESLKAIDHKYPLLFDELKKASEHFSSVEYGS